MYYPLWLKIQQMIKIFEEQGYVLVLFCGERTLYQQEIEFLKGRDEKGNIIDETKVVTDSRPGYSWHNYNLAGDCVFKVDGKLTWDNSDKKYDKLCYVAKSLGLESGGDFPRVDKCHIQITNGLPIEKAKELFENGNYELVWKAVEELKKV